MKVTSPYKCDYCERLKGATNHWWLLFLDQFPASKSPAFLLVPWDEADPDSKAKPEHICSESCAVKALNKWMAERKATTVSDILQPMMDHRFGG